MLGPLLQKPTENPHATLVMVFMNAISEMTENDAPVKPKQAEILGRYQNIRNIFSIHPAIAIFLYALLSPLGSDVEKDFARRVSS